MYTVLVISIIIVIVVLLLTLLTTNRAYSYKHTIDPIEDNPYLDNTEDFEQKRD